MSLTEEGAEIAEGTNDGKSDSRHVSLAARRFALAGRRSSQRQFLYFLYSTTTAFILVFQMFHYRATTF